MTTKEQEVKKQLTISFEDEKKDNYIKFLEDKISKLIDSYSFYASYNDELSESNHIMQDEISKLEKEIEKLKKD